jgi:heterodisulfide reductase subunit A
MAENTDQPKVQILVNGRAHEVPEGATVLEALIEAGVEVPTLCRYPGMEPYGACRLCLVEIGEEDEGRLTTSCDLKATEGMKVWADTDRVVRSRQLLLRLLLARCPKNSDVKELASRWGVTKTPFPTLGEKDEDCVLCGLCVRVCHDVIEAGALGLMGRGLARRIEPPPDGMPYSCRRCGACLTVCPTGAMKLDEWGITDVKPLVSDFNVGLSTRHAAYMPFPQAVPNAPVIDAAACMNLMAQSCKLCEEVCGPGAIDHTMEEKTHEAEIGAIVVATGFDPFDPNEKPELGYDRYPGVVTAMEMERLLSASGPTGGDVLIEGKKPRKVVFVQCVGSRDATVNVEYCSRVCCMYTAKQAHMVKDRVPKAEVSVLYMDIRAFGKGYEEFYDRVRAEGILYRRASVSEIYRNAKRKLIVLAEDTLLGQPMEIEADMVVLAVGIRPRPVTDDVARVLRLSKSADGFLSEAHPKLRPVDTTVDGVFLAGCCQGPKDIPDTVAQAKAASSSALVLLSRGKVQVEPSVAWVDEDVCAGCGLCEAVCEYEAVRVADDTGRASVTPAMCKGCGACAVACPSNAVTVSFWTPQQLLAQIGAL